MGTLSANTLFHFTKTKENIISILLNGFYPRYCLEDPFSSGKPGFAFPMVCFCDIPLSQIQNHSSQYGNYALGLTKEWAKKNGVSPVLYTYKTAQFLKNIEKYKLFLSTHHSEIRVGEKHDVKEMIDFLFSIALYTKPYEKSNIRYYDEREWRYSIDTKLKEEEILYNNLLKNTNFADSAKRDAANEKMIQYKLNFEPKDINYIIVPTDSEVLQIMDEVRNIKGAFPYNDVKLLTTRIISMERIKEDF